jgi:hypothetical protein
VGIKKITAKEFREKGYLQELNRRFLHPLGLALEVIINEEDESEQFGSVWVADDDEGWVFGNPSPDKEKADSFQELINERHVKRKEALGFIVQPVE